MKHQPSNAFFNLKEGWRAVSPTRVLALGAPVVLMALLAVNGLAPAAALDEPEDGAATSEEEGDLDKTFGNRLRWSTASEVDNFGYDVYRSESKEGPFSRITVDPVVGAGTTDEPTKYEYTDETIATCTPYFYYVESISMGGTRERFTPVIPAKGKGDCETSD